MNKPITITEELYAYIRTVAQREDPVLQLLREETALMPEAEAQITAEQGQFLALLARLVGARKTLEIGVFTGYSSLVIALTLPDRGRIVACDIHEEWTTIARRYWRMAQVEEKITLHLAPAVETLQHLLDAGEAETFDFAFIDADKVNYDHYYEYCLRLVRPGGLLVLDNMLREGHVISGTQEEGAVAIRALNQKLRDDTRVAATLLPMADGITLAYKL